MMCLQVYAREFFKRQNEVRYRFLTCYGLIGTWNGPLLYVNINDRCISHECCACFVFLA